MKKCFFPRLILAALLLFFVSLPAYCSDEPNNHLGWTLSELQAKYPTLLKIEDKGNTVVYVLGESDEVGVSWYFTLKDNVVFSEIWFIRSKDSEAMNFFLSMAKGFAILCKEAPIIKSENEVHFKLDTYMVDLSYEARPNGINWTIMKYNMIIK